MSLKSDQLELGSSIVINKFSYELLFGMLVLIAHESSEVSGNPARSAVLPEP